LSGTHGEVGCTSSNGILTSRDWFVGRQERKAGVHNHKDLLVKKQLQQFYVNKISKIYKRQFEKNCFSLRF
jgi:hypothetical protein